MIRLFLDNRTAVLLLLPFIIGLYVIGTVFSVDQEHLQRANGMFFYPTETGGFWTYFIQSFLIASNFSAHLNQIIPQRYDFRRVTTDTFLKIR